MACARQNRGCGGGACRALSGVLAAKGVGRTHAARSRPPRCSQLAPATRWSPVSMRGPPATGASNGRLTASPALQFRAPCCRRLPCPPQQSSFHPRRRCSSCASRSSPPFCSPFNLWSARPATLNSVTVSTTSPATRRARFTDDYKRVIIEDKNEVAQFVGEMATSNVLYVLIRSINRGSTSAEFHLDGASAAIGAAFAGCPISPARHAGRAPMPHPAA